ncbi:MAG: alpha-L-fucosidase [Acutalibacteraceae bacterium]
MDSKLTGAELASQLKGQLNSNMKFNGISGIDDESLHLSEEDIKWWRDAKFGLFVHWGVYSLLGRGEWTYFNDKLDEEYYRNLAKNEFKPNRSAEEIMDGWTTAAVEAGMKYAVMVTRHHDGYALWDSQCSYKDFTSVRCGSGEDYVKAFTDACREKGLYTGLYYSPMDWRFDGYFHPKENPENALLMKKQGYGQIEELCSHYGKIDILWYDGGWLAHQGTDYDSAWLWEPIKLNKMVRSYNPKCMVTPRSGYKGDFECDEGPHEIKGKIVPIPWEKNMSLTEHWAYVEHDRSWTFEYIIRMLVNAVGRDGNLLLNMAPDRNGNIPENSLSILRMIGEWLKMYGESIYGTRAGVFEPVDDVYVSTQKENSVYIHILDCRQFDQLMLPGIDRKIISAEILNGETLDFKQKKAGTKIRLSEFAFRNHAVDTIVKLTLKSDNKSRHRHRSQERKS